jgi:hypothetical protein
VACARLCSFRHAVCGHHAKAKVALRAGAVNARRPRGTRGRSEAKSIDGAEHSGMMKGVMAVAQIE